MEDPFTAESAEETQSTAEQLGLRACGAKDRISANLRGSLRFPR